MSLNPIDNAPEQTNEPKKKSINIGTIFLVLFLLATPVFVIYMMKDPVDDAQRHQAEIQQAQDQKVADEKNDLQQKIQNNQVTDIGGDGTLQGSRLEKGGQSDIVVLAHNADDFNAFVKANAASDGYGINDLTSSGRVFSIPSGQVQAKKIDFEAFSNTIQVRILTGEHRGEAAWTDAECLQKQ